MNGPVVRAAMTGWQRLHFRFGIPAPLLEPLAVERLYLDNFFSTAKASRDLGYQPMFNTEQALSECLSYYVEMFDEMKRQALLAKASAAPAGATTATTGTPAPAPVGTAQQPGGIWGMMPLFVVGAFMIFWIFWQTRKQNKQREQLNSSVKKHDKVVTTSGIIGTIVELNDQEMVLQVENGKIRFSRSALASVMKSSETKTEVKGDSKIEAKPLTTASV